MGITWNNHLSKDSCSPYSEPIYVKDTQERGEADGGWYFEVSTPTWTWKNAAVLHSHFHWKKWGFSPWDFPPSKTMGFFHFFCVEIQEDPMVFMKIYYGILRSKSDSPFSSLFRSAKGMICDHDCSQDPKWQGIHWQLMGKWRNVNLTSLPPFLWIVLAGMGFSRLHSKLPIGRKMIFVSFWPMGFCWWIWGSKFRENFAGPPLISWRMSYGLRFFPLSSVLPSPGIMISNGNHPNIALFQVSESLQFIYPDPIEKGTSWSEPKKLPSGRRSRRRDSLRSGQLLVKFNRFSVFWGKHMNKSINLL